MAIYAALDLAIIAAVGALSSLSGIVALSFGSKLAFALAGAHLASRRTA